ncbi:PRC-barrel domain containing protein [Pikeienuella piscinae]|uniref:PRC-barrel domain containing protein n=1 Tax=Pikeienuella piscinae TaxID=2748098 RepID=A0A7L5C0B0_9RHOB|nr:PRC-barrel domain-containing protein [Pikeienuella piscinae]QIE56207.1 PRC-barrel domain containing protein [Pikeienuella piscinae]
MKRILATTALVSLLAAPVLAQESATKSEQAAPAAAATETAAPKTDYSQSSAPVVGGDKILASDFIDRPVYVGVIEGDAGVADASADWEHIGEISDVIMSKDGAIHSVLVDVGGFLGMGEHTVAVGLDQVSIVQDSDDPDEVFIVSEISREELEAMPEFDESEAGYTRLGDAGAAEMDSDAATVTDHAAAPAVGTEAAEPAANGMVAGDSQQWVEADFTKLTTEDLDGATVYSSNDEAIGEIDKLLLAQDGKVSSVLVDVGGFLGMGEKPVSLPFSKLKVMQNEDGDEVRVVVDQTRESLEAMPDYKS